MKKKVLVLRTMPYDFDPNSYNVQEIGIGKAFCKLGYDYDYITVKKRDQKEWVFYEENGCRAKWIEVPRLRVLRMGFNFDVCKKEFLEQYDYVICREYYQLMTHLVAKNSNNASFYSGPYWNMFMIPFMSYVYDFFYTKKLNKNAKCKFVKSDLAKAFLEKKGYTDVKTVGVALDTERFDSCNEMTDDTKKIVDYMNSNDCILYIGTLDKNKNYMFLLQVYEKLLEKNPDLKFVVIGKSKQSAVAKLMGKKDESYEESCYEKISPETKKGIYRVNRVENPQLKYIYPLAKAFLLPSKLEIFGMVMLEAMYLKAPVVTSKNGGSVTLIEGKDTGKMIDEFDVTRWADAVQEYLDDEEKTRQIAENAHATVRDKYNWDYIVKTMLADMEEK